MEVKIYSPDVILVEGDAKEFVPHTEQARGMHGFAIMLPTGEGSEWLLDLVWRVAMAYAGRRTLLMNRKMVQKMVEAVMNANPEDPTKTRGHAIRHPSPRLAKPKRRVPTKAGIDPTPTKTRIVSAGGRAGAISAVESTRKVSARKKS